jgi:hypothetical protein
MDDIRRRAPPAPIPWRQLGSIITLMRIGSQTFTSTDGSLMARGNDRSALFRRRPEPNEKNALGSPTVGVVSSTPT